MAEKCGRVSRFSLDPEKQKIYEKRAEQWGEKAENLKSEELTQRRRQRLAERRRGKIQSAFDQMSAGQLRDYIDNNLVTEFTGLDGANTDFVREAVKVISTFEEMMGGKTIDGLSVQFGGTPKGVYAKYNDKTKTILLKKTGSIEKLEESLKRENLRYRMRWKTDKDYHATETFSGQVWHELGHAVDVDTGQALSRSLSADSALDELSVKVSSYAGSTQNVRATKRSEAWAENFAAYMDGGRNKERVPKQIEEKIKGYFEQKAAGKAKNVAKAGKRKPKKADVPDVKAEDTFIPTKIFEQSGGDERGRWTHLGDRKKFITDHGNVFAKRIKNSGNRLHVSDDITLSRRQVRQIDGLVSEAKRLLGVTNDCNIPFVIINSNKKLASYNPRRNVVLINMELLDSENVRIVQSKYACPDNINSTLVHELIHWMDAEEYRKKVGVINDSSPGSEYTRYQNLKAKKALKKAGIDFTDTKCIRDDISEYARAKLVLENDYEEVYTEYRTKLLLTRKS